MRLVCRIALWCAVLLASGWGPVGVTPECAAQGTGRIKTEVTLPGIGRVRGTLRVLPRLPFKKRGGRATWLRIWP